jgi:hypothetical protein
MRAIVAAVAIAASILGSSTAWSACVPGRLGGCVNLDLVPQVSQQIVADEHIAPAPKAVPPAATSGSYTGPTVGTAPNVRRAPTVGYRWALD